MDERTEKLEKLRKSLEESIAKIKKDFEDDKTEYTEEEAKKYKHFRNEGVGIFEKALADLPLPTEEIIDNCRAEFEEYCKVVPENSDDNPTTIEEYIIAAELDLAAKREFVLMIKSLKEPMEPQASNYVAYESAAIKRIEKELKEHTEKLTAKSTYWEKSNNQKMIFVLEFVKLVKFYKNSQAFVIGLKPIIDAIHDKGVDNINSVVDFQDVMKNTLKAAKERNVKAKEAARKGADDES